MSQTILPTAGTDAVDQLRSELANSQALLQVFESRYNQEHQRGLSLELMNKRLEMRVTVLEQENTLLRAEVAKPTTTKPTKIEE